jgi:hypothetical protein
VGGTEAIWWVAPRRLVGGTVAFGGWHRGGLVGGTGAIWWVAPGRFGGWHGDVAGGYSESGPLGCSAVSLAETFARRSMHFRRLSHLEHLAGVGLQD